MQLFFSLIVSICLAFCVVLFLEQYTAQERQRQWLGLSHRAMTFRDKLINLLSRGVSSRFQGVEQNLIRAGIYNPRLARLFFPIKIITAFSLVGVILLFARQLGLEEFRHQFLAAGAALALVITVPDTVLNIRSRKRTRRVSAQLPYLLDLMGVCIQTGMTIESSITYIGEELENFDRDIAYIMRRVASVARMSGLDSALKELSSQFPSNQMKSFVYTLRQSLQYGSSIYHVLTTQAANLRQVEMLILEEQVAKLSAKMSVPLILFIVFPLVILTTAPAVMRLLEHGI